MTAFISERYITLLLEAPTTSSIRYEKKPLWRDIYQTVLLENLVQSLTIHGVIL